MIFGKLFSDRYTQGDRYIQGRYIQVWLYANSSKNIPNSWLQCKNHYLFETKMAEIDTLSDQNGLKTIPFWTHILHERS